jgi:Ser/Thr protein kinase RdoA (MazF antagonist)
MGAGSCCQIEVSPVCQMGGELLHSLQQPHLAYAFDVLSFLPGLAPHNTASRQTMTTYGMYKQRMTFDTM